MALELSEVSTDTDVFKAIAQDQAFPRRPGGRIPLGRIGVSASSAKPIQFTSPVGPATFQPSAGAFSEIGVYDVADEALKALPIDTPPGMELSAGGAGTDRYLFMRWGLRGGFKFSATHPVGALTSVTFGTDVSGARFYGLVHRFSEDAGARKVMEAAARSWCLPRHVGRRGPDGLCLEPGTWVMSETDASIGVQVGARVGYDFSIAHPFAVGGQNLAAKVDAAVSATFGFNVSGRFLLVAGRESADPASKQIRLRLFKQRRNGWEIALNAGVGFRAAPDLPEKVDDFVQAVFGVHGQQVLSHLEKIEEWTEHPPGEAIARKARETGLQLLHHVSGLPPGTDFKTLRQGLAGVLRRYVQLPGPLQSQVWEILAGGDPGQEGRFTGFLRALTATNPQDRARALADAIQRASFGDSVEGKFLGAASEFGLLVAAPQIQAIEVLARQTLTAVEYGALGRLIRFVRERLNLSQFTGANTQSEFDAIDGWLIRLMSNFFGKTLALDDLDDVRKAIHLAATAHKKVYAKAVEALSHRFSAELAVNYRKATSRTALLDITFDLSKPKAEKAWRDVVDDSLYDNVFAGPIDGVTVHQGVLTHGIKRESSVQVQLPFFNKKVEHINDTLARLEHLDAEANGGRVLVYHVEARDTVRDQERFLSELSLMGGFRLDSGNVITPDLADKRISFQFRQAKARMRLADLQRRVDPFLKEHFRDQLTGEDPVSTFLVNLDATVEELLGNGKNNFGDALLAMELSMPASLLAGWLKPLDPVGRRAAKNRISLAIQREMRRILPVYYFNDSSHLQNNEAMAAMLLWSSLVPCTSMRLDPAQRVLERFSTGERPYWDWRSPVQRDIVAGHAESITAMERAMLNYEERLISEGRGADAAVFERTNRRRLRDMGQGPGTNQFQALLGMEARIIAGAADAVEEIQTAISAAEDDAAAAALEALAKFGGTLSESFHARVKSVYGDEASRAIGSMVLVEATRALDPANQLTAPTAALRLIVLNEERSFELSDWMKNRAPLEEDVAVAQTLISSR